MRTSLALLVILGSIACADEPKKEDSVKAELQKLEGKWVVEAAFVRGVEIERHHGKHFVIKGATMSSDLDSKEESGDFKIDPTMKVKSIDTTPAGKKVVLGVYELDGDILKLCFGDESMRPKKVNNVDLLYILKRVK